MSIIDDIKYSNFKRKVKADNYKFLKEHYLYECTEPWIIAEYDDKQIFQKVKEKCIMYISLNNIDLSKYNFKGVDSHGVNYKDGVILPNTKDFLQELCDKDISGCHIPPGDYLNWDFSNVSMDNTIFNKNTKIAITENFLTGLKSCIGVVLPDGDYSKCKTEGVNFNWIEFTEDSILPKELILEQEAKVKDENEKNEDYIKKAEQQFFQNENNNLEQSKEDNTNISNSQIENETYYFTELERTYIYFKLDKDNNLKPASVEDVRKKGVCLKNLDKYYEEIDKNKDIEHVVEDDDGFEL